MWKRECDSYRVYLRESVIVIKKKRERMCVCEKIV